MTEQDLIAANTQVMAAYRRAWEEGTVQDLFALYRPGFTINYFGHSPLAGTHRGLEAAMKVLAQVSRRSGRSLIAVDDIIVGPRKSVVLVRERFQRDGRTADLSRCFVYELVDGGLAECWVYDADQATVDEFLAD